MRLEQATLGDGMVNELAQYIQKHHPEIKGFDKFNLYRMCRFYEAYKDCQIVAPVVPQLQTADNEGASIVAPVVQQLQDEPFELSDLSDIRNTLLAQISWSHHLIIIGRSKIPEEREFYIRLCISEHYSKRELDRQISSSTFERVMIGNSKLTKTMKKLPQDMTNALKEVITAKAT